MQASDYKDLRSPDTRAAALETATQRSAPAPDRDLRSPDARDAGPIYVSASQPLPVADVSSTSDGFDWTSATIGAGVGLLLMLLVAAGVSRRGRSPLVRSQRHGV